MKQASAALAAMLWVTAPAVAQTKHAYPTKPIRLVVAFSAGGTPDTLARMIAPRSV